MILYLLQDFQRNVFTRYRFSLDMLGGLPNFFSKRFIGLSWRGLFQSPTSLKLPESTLIHNNLQFTSISHATNIQDIVAQCLKHNTPAHRGWRQTSCRQGPGCEWRFDSGWSTLDGFYMLKSMAHIWVSLRMFQECQRVPPDWTGHFTMKAARSTVTRRICSKSRIHWPWMLTNLFSNQY